MAIPERDTVYSNDANRTVYARESNGTAWFVGIIVVLALLAIGYLVFSANSGPSTTVDVNNTPAVTAPADPAASTTPMTSTPADSSAPAANATPAAPAANTTPMTAAPADAAPAATAPAANSTQTPATTAP